MQLKPNTLLQGGKYKIVRTLGQGGFGITYEAEQVLLRRRVAVKEFFMKDCCERDDATSRVTIGTGSQRALVEKFRGKFIREAQMIAGMDHPHIVRVLDVFEENDTAYYVMDYLTGGSLADKVKKDGPLSEDKAEAYIRQVAEALAYIHSQNTVHLDVKPSNILLNAKDEAVLVDFGISKHYDDTGEQTSSTPVGISKGYAPLEQGRDGDVSQFGPSTDVYALGATLYYLVTGLVPPEASLVNEDGLARIPNISPRVWKTIEESMQPRRKDRPQSIDEFLSFVNTTHLIGIPADEDVTILKDPITTSAPKTQNPKDTVSVLHSKNNPWLWILLGCLVVASMALAFFVGRNRGNSDNEKEPTVASDTVVSAQTQVPPQEDIIAKDVPVVEPALESPGSIKVNSEPSGASIWLDGKNTYKTTPDILENISPGRHSIRLVLNGYTENKSSISVASGQRTNVSKTLTASSPQSTEWASTASSNSYSTTSTTRVINSYQCTKSGDDYLVNLSVGDRCRFSTGNSVDRWIATNTDKATVTYDGVVTAKATGLTYVLAKKGDKFVSFKVTISSRGSSSSNRTTSSSSSSTSASSRTPSSYSMPSTTRVINSYQCTKKGDDYLLYLSVGEKCRFSTGMRVDHWIATNTDKATVTSDGVVTAKATGLTYILAKKGDDFVSFKVTISSQ